MFSHGVGSVKIGNCCLVAMSSSVHVPVVQHGKCSKCNHEGVNGLGVIS